MHGAYIRVSRACKRLPLPVRRKVGGSRWHSPITAGEANLASRDSTFNTMLQIMIVAVLKPLAPDRCDEFNQREKCDSSSSYQETAAQLRVWPTDHQSPTS
jgi:hypothetical protein